MLPEIDLQQLAQVRASAAVMVVDVREADEYRGGHVPDARLIPLKVLGAGLRAMNVRGGTAAWIQAGQPVEHGIGTEATR